MTYISYQSESMGWLLEVLFWVRYLFLSCMQVHAHQGLVLYSCISLKAETILERS